MEPKLFCQSCGMPIDQPAMRGTEGDGYLSDKYCVYCYQSGQLVHPDMTLKQMTERVRRKLQEMHLSESFIDGAVKALPHLERWAGERVI